jgi:hypothetical protein
MTLHLRHEIALPRSIENARMAGGGEKDSELSFDGSRLDCVDFLFDVLKASYSVVLGLYGL